MKPLKFFITAMVLGCLVAPGYAQILKPGEVAREAGTSQVNTTESSTIHNGIHQASNAIKGLFKK